MQRHALEGVGKVDMLGLVWWIAAFLMAFCAGPCWGRGGGGCLREGAPVMTPGGEVAIEALQKGDVIVGVRNGALGPARVESVLKILADGYLELATDGANLMVTEEHPVMVGAGTFKMAGWLEPGEFIVTSHGDTLGKEQIRSARRVRENTPAYNLLVSPGGTYISGRMVVHNKGCFLPDSPVLMADGREAAISAVKRGDTVMAFTTEGRLVGATVRNILTHDVDEHVMVKTDRTVLQVTSEHPFYVGEGTFKTVEALAAGDSIMAWDGQTLAPQRIISMETIPGRTRVHNLQTDYPHTFFVGHVAVHNKGGGGGCFPAGTPIATIRGSVPIESLAPGDQVLTISEEGLPVSTPVKALLVARNSVMTLRTNRGHIKGSPNHPVGKPGGEFLPLSELREGDRILRWAHNRLRPETVRRHSPPSEPRLVFNLQVDAPHTFLASNVLVHNKGGRSGGFSSSGTRTSGTSSSGSGKTEDWEEWVEMAFLLGLPGLGIYWVLKRASTRRRKDNLDFVFDSNAIGRKARRTEKLLDFLALQDPSVAPGALKNTAQFAFLKLQECWQNREYDPMRPLMLESLFTQHKAQLAGMVRNHEINRVDELKVEEVDLVNVRYTERPHHREFTALISASARDYYVHDATGKFLRGDKSPARFQEFWTFQFMENQWLLREIEQSGESDILKDENVVEMLTDDRLQAVYGEAGGDRGPVGPWLEKETGEKTTRIERMLNFLVQTDRLWNRQLMLERARDVFLKVYLAREAGEDGQVPVGDLFPEAAEALRGQLRQWRLEDITVEYRNLCVRKAEIVLVRNYQDRVKDEYTVRLTAHAQRVVHKGGRVMSEDRYVKEFEDYWTFGRREEAWKLKEVLPPARGIQRMREENVDEDSTPGQLNWYYRQTRAN